MALEEVAEYALSEEADQPVATIGQDPSAQDEPMGYLTAREQEVAALVARGLTNRQVSTKLSISERTAGNHVAKILKKLGAPLAGSDRSLGGRRSATYVSTRLRLHTP
jgi:non-specific serine/threonine protein kinase